MLSDRPYMRGEYQREKTSGLTWLLSAMIAGFVLQVVLGLRLVERAPAIGFENLFGTDHSVVRERLGLDAVHPLVAP